MLVWRIPALHDDVVKKEVGHAKSKNYQKSIKTMGFPIVTVQKKDCQSRFLCAFAR